MESKSDRPQTFAVFIDAAAIVGAFATAIGTVVLTRRLTPAGSWLADELDDALIGSAVAAVSVAIPLALSRTTWMERTWFLFAGIWMIIAWQAGMRVRGSVGDIGNWVFVGALCQIAWLSGLGVLLRVVTGFNLRQEVDGDKSLPGHRFALRHLLLSLTALCLTLAAVGWVFPPWSSENTRHVTAAVPRLATQVQFVTWGIAVTTVAGTIVFRWRLLPGAIAISLVALTMNTWVNYWPGRLPGLGSLAKTVLMQTIRFVGPGLVFAIPPLLALRLRGYRLTKNPR